MKTLNKSSFTLFILLFALFFASSINLYSQSIRDAGKIKSFQYQIFYSDIAEEFKKYLPDIDNVMVISKYYLPKVAINNSNDNNGAYFENGYMFIYLNIDEAYINNQKLYYGGIAIQVNILSDAWDEIYTRHQYLLTNDLTTQEFNTDCRKMISNLINDFSIEYYKYK